MTPTQYICYPNHLSAEQALEMIKNDPVFSMQLKPPAKMHQTKILKDTIVFLTIEK